MKVQLLCFAVLAALILSTVHAQTPPDDELVACLESGDGSRGNIKRIQELLTKMGYSPGTPDGTVGKRTRDALKAWNATRGDRPVNLEEFFLGTTAPDFRTLRAWSIGTVIIPDPSLGPKAAGLVGIEYEGEQMTDLYGGYGVETTGRLKAADDKQITVAFRGQTRTFTIDESTMFCVDDQRDKSWRELPLGNYVTISSQGQAKHARRVRTGKNVQTMGMMRDTPVKSKCWR